MPDLNPVDEPEEENGRVETLVQMARTLIADWPRFSPMLPPEVASHGIRAFKTELRSRAFAHFCADYAEKRICGGNLVRLRSRCAPPWIKILWRWTAWRRGGTPASI